jgi:hypothetical protein
MVRTFTALLCAIFLVTALSGCRQNVDLSAVRALADQVGSSSDAFATLANDFYGSCIRTYNWKWSAALSRASMQPLAQECDTSQTAARQWQDANLIVIEYVQALGSLAGGGDSGTDFGIPTLVQSISGTTHAGLTGDQTKAISDAATSIVTDIFNIRRRNELAKYIPQANAHLSSIIDKLEDVAQTNYNTQLNLEQDAIDRFFVSVAPPAGGAMQPVAAPTIEQLQARLAQSVKRRSSNTIMRNAMFDRAMLDIDRVQILTLRHEYEKQRAAADERRKAIGAYVSALETIRAVHQQLTASIASNTQGDIRAIVQAYIDKYGPEVRAIQTAFSSQGTTP